MLRATDDIVCGFPFPFPFEQQVGVRDRIGLGVDLLPVEVGRNLLVSIRNTPDEVGDPIELSLTLP